jgi:ribonuclease P protein component
MPKQFTLNKQERIKSRKAIEQLFSEGKRFTVNPFRVFYLLQDTGKESTVEENPKSRIANLQFGVGVSTKNFKKAVDRNRIKRLTREAWRLQKNTVGEILQAKQKSLHVFLVYTGKELPVYADVFAKVTVILKKLRPLLDENNTSHS